MQVASRVLVPRDGRLEAPEYGRRNMPIAVETLNAWSQSWGTMMLAVLWQSTLLAALVAGAVWLARRSAPALRFWLWQILAIKLLLMPLWTLALPLPSFFATKSPPPAISERLSTLPQLPPVADLPAQDIGPAIVDGATSRGSPATRQVSATPAAVRVTTWLFGGWLLFVSWRIGRMVRQRWRLRRLLNGATAAEPPLVDFVRQACERLGLRRAPRVLITDENCSPLACGIMTPTLVLPCGVVKSLGATELLHVVLHELAHVRRRDLIWNWPAEIARVLYFFHPVAHWACRQIHLERELACDALALAASQASAADYADTLVRVVSHVSQPNATCTE